MGWMAGMRIAKGGQRPRHTGLLDTVLVQRVENYAKVFAYIYQLNTVCTLFAEGYIDGQNNHVRVYLSSADRRVSRY